MSSPPRTARIVVEDRTARIVAGPHVARVVRFDRTVVIVVPFPIVAPPPVGDSGQLDFSNVNNSAWIGAV
jgi:hypothetical protein